MAAILQGTPAPDFALAALNGETLQLSAWRGTPVLLNFFQSTCAWCRVEMPRLAEIYRRREDVDVKIVGIAVGGDTLETARRFAHDKQLDFPIAVDADGRARESFGLERVPTLMLINGDGNIACVYEGSSEQLRGIVEQTILAAAHGDKLPDYALIGNGCAP